jgi:tyrosyl-tRNA synthetase
MSKSDPSSAIFMDDSEEEVVDKIRRAFCPPNEVANNPCVLYFQQLVFPLVGSAGFTMKRDDSDGGDLHYMSYEALAADFASGKLHPTALKPNLAHFINQCLAPVRLHFAKNEAAAKLLALVRTYRTTRHTL